MKRLSLFFTAPREIEIREDAVPEPAPAEVLVGTTLSAISPGTETLIYRGEFPAEIEMDESIPALAGEFAYPFQYGYCALGEVTALGAGVDRAWLGRQVFAFQPHESHFTAAVDGLHPLPEGIALEQAVFLPNMETAVNLVMDGKPLLGERVVVCGQGIVGLLTTALLAQFPLETLVTLDLHPARREVSRSLGAHASLDPTAADIREQLEAVLPGGADLAFEVSGSPAALDDAIAATGFGGRVVIGSWYGSKRASLDLGGRFHRSRMRLVSSQVSTVAPELSGRWTKARRLDAAWGMLHQLETGKLITHRYPIQEAPLAYQHLDQHPQDAIQIVLTYE